jgi:hypothetical protein
VHLFIQFFTNGAKSAEKPAFWQDFPQVKAIHAKKHAHLQVSIEIDSHRAR